jgi:hypothetical protein
VSHLGAARVIFDMADDWGELMPGRSARFATLYARIAQEADEIIVVNQALVERFPGRQPIVIRNGLDAKTVAEATERAASTSDQPQMTYLGTLSPRFDEELVRRVLDLLPDWRLQLIGPATYPGFGARPSPELARLLDHDRVIWRGPLERAAAIELVAGSEVAIVPHRHDHALGQDSMKFYDYAGAGIPIVSTGWFDQGLDVPPLLALADSPEAFAANVTRAAGADEAARSTQREWAAGNTWESRWPRWSDAVFGRRMLV